MLSSPIPLARRSVPPRHLYRHLLRAASYLPPVCVPYISTRIKEQFHKHVRNKHLAEARVLSGLRQLRRLQSANSGSLKDLRHVFLLTFGRSGAYRRKLVAPVLLPDPPATSDEAPDEAQAPPVKRRNPKSQAVYERARMDTHYKKNFINRWDFAKLEKYLQSQATHAKHTSPAIWAHAPPTRASPISKVPEKNIWGNTLPIRALRTILKQWWLLNVPKIAPPLGAGEWDTLRDLSTCKETGPLLKMPPRRPVAVPVHGLENQAEPAWNWKAYASHAVSVVERERNSGFQQSATGFAYNPVPEFSKKPMSNRKLRRLAGKVFEASPYMKRDDSTANSKMVWGFLVPDYPVASARNSWFFDNVDASGSGKEERRKKWASQA